MRNTVLIFIVLTINTGAIEATTFYQQPMGCPEKCECDDTLSSTVCSRRNLTTIPLVPVTSLYAYFDRNPFENTHLAAENFTSLPYVRGLYLRGCGITHFNAGTFRDLKFLRELDLSYNKIAFISRGSFANLQLEFLDLGYNPALRLMPDSFCGAAISRLSLKCCDLEHINVQTFHPLFDSITSLTLSCNDLETIPAPLVWSPSHLTTLNIRDNPRLTCDCNMAWITRRQSLQKQVFKVDFTPKGCEGDSSSVIIQTGSNDDNCSTDVVMLKDIDYGLCVRSLEALKMVMTLANQPLTTTTVAVTKKARNKSVIAKTTPSMTLATTGSLLPIRTRTGPTVPSPIKTDEYSGDDYFVGTSPPSLPSYNSSKTSTSTLSNALLINIDDSNFTSRISGNIIRCNNEQTSPPGTAVDQANPALQYTRVNMFTACVASATFTFISALLCFCANRICSDWVSDHRRRIDAKRRGDSAGWGKPCSICSSTHETAARQISTAVAMAFAPPSNSGTSDINNSRLKCPVHQQQQAEYGRAGVALTLKPSVSYPNSDDLMRHSATNSIICTPQSSPKVIGKGGVYDNAAVNKQTLRVRMALAK